MEVSAGAAVHLFQRLRALEHKDALGLESAEHNPYANILVTTPALKDDPRIRQLARDLESRAIADFIRKSYKGSVIPVAGRQS